MKNDIAYANRDFIPDADSFPPRWAAEAEAFRASQGDRARLGLRYGDGARHVFDLFRPPATPRGTLVFVHGGYWRMFDRSIWSAFAAGGIARGWAVAMPSYTLAPEATIPGITGEIAAAIRAVARETEGPIVLTGHSAGGHLVARMLCGDIDPGDDGRIARCGPISPVADLRPLLETSMNADLRLDASMAESESPALMQQARDVPVSVWVGEDERPAFLDQARWLATAWDAPMHVEAGRHHFDVIDGLKDPGSPLIASLLDGL